jgi:hypothetical protein
MKIDSEWLRQDKVLKTFCGVMPFKSKCKVIPKTDSRGL